MYCFVSVRNLFAYSSTDRLIYLRQFATKGSDMKLVATMKGHVSEVAKVRNLQVYFAHTMLHHSFPLIHLW